MSDLERAFALVSQSRGLAVLTGAGISAESGIPTFRGLGGFWRGRDPARLATPEAFASDPELVWEFYNYRRERVGQAEPNPAHHALARLEQQLSHMTLITQNVDRLHQRAGSRTVLELHGNLWDVRCTGCRQVFDRAGVTLPPFPRCEHCGALLRPAVVWFGESLPAGVWDAAEDAVTRADLFLVVGTSAVVYPAAGLIDVAHGSAAEIVEINLEPTPYSGQVDISLLGKAGEILPQLVPNASA